MGYFVKNQKIEKHCKWLYINRFIAFSFLCWRRLCPGSGYHERTSVKMDLQKPFFCSIKENDEDKTDAGLDADAVRAWSACTRNRQFSSGTENV